MLAGKWVDKPAVNGPIIMEVVRRAPLLRESEVAPGGGGPRPHVQVGSLPGNRKATSRATYDHLLISCCWWDSRKEWCDGSHG